jgi:hypothetical protein
MIDYVLVYDTHTGALSGAVRAGETYVPRSAPAWAEVEAWAAAQVPAVDLSDRDAPSAADKLAATRAVALGGLLTRPDEVGLAVRATVAAVTYLFNNRLESVDAQLRALGAAGIPAPVRVQEAEILTYLMANPTVGDPAM